VRRSECPREADLLEALHTGAWPDCCPDDLRAHAADCPSCADLVALVLPLLEEHRADVREVSVPSSAVMWWKLQMRARREATARAMRPISAVQGVTLACAVGLLVAALGLVLPEASQAVTWLGSVTAGAAAAGSWSLPSTVAQLLSPGGIALLLAGALLLIVTPVAIYFAMSDW
jgi:hypothetical protein